MKDIKAALKNHIKSLRSKITAEDVYSGFPFDLIDKPGEIGLGGTALGLIMFRLDGHSIDDKSNRCAKFIAGRQEANNSWTIKVFSSRNVFMTYATCYALEALLIYNKDDDSKQYQSVINNGIDWIIVNQNPKDGGWGLYNGGDSHIHSTSEVLNLFFFIRQYYNQKYIEITNIEDIINQAKQWLKKQKKSDGSWADANGKYPHFFTSLVYKSLVQFNINNTDDYSSTEKWLLKSYSDVSEFQMERLTYRIQDIDEHIDCIIKSIIFESVSSHITTSNYKQIKNMSKYFIKKQNPDDGFWHTDSKTSPVFMNFRIYYGLHNLREYERKNASYLKNTIKDLFRGYPYRMIIIGSLTIYGSIEIIHKLSKQLLIDSFCINEFWEKMLDGKSVSNFALFTSITGLTLIRIYQYIKEWFKKS